MDDNLPHDPPEHVYDQYQRPGTGDAVSGQEPLGFVGWIVLTLLLFFLIAGSLYSTFKSGPTANYHERELPVHISTRKSPALVGPAPSLDNIIADLENSKDKDPKAAIQWGVYSDLAGKKLSPKDLEILTKSEKKEEKALGEILAAEKLSASESDRLAGQLGAGTAADYVKLRAKEKAGQPADWSTYRKTANTALKNIAIVIGMGMVGGLLLFGYVVGRSSGKFKPMGHPALPMTQLESDAYAMKAFLMLLVIGLLPAFIPAVTGGFPGSSTVGAILTIIAVLGVGKLRIWGQKTDRWSFKSAAKGLKVFGQGAVIYLMGIPFIGFMMVLGPTLFGGLPSPDHPVTEAIPNSTPIQLLAIFVSAAIQAPITEELAFRGSMLPALTRLLRSPIAAVIIVNLAFAAIHPTGVPSWPALAAIGAVASFAVYQTGSIWAAVSVHAIHNFLTLLLAFSTLR